VILAQCPAAVAPMIASAVGVAVRAGAGCGHLGSGGRGFVCVTHPTGVRCEACHADHVAGHTHAEEHTCDVCGDELGRDGSMAAALFGRVDVPLLVHAGAGVVLWLPGLCVSGWGACWSCHVDLSRASTFGGEQ
jgi:hypothetical protein